MNRVILIGNLTKDPEFTTTNSGVSCVKFTIATQRKYKNENGEYESDFPQCLAWRNTADFINKYFKKGNKIAVVGKIQTSSYDAADGSKRYKTEVVVEEAEFVQARKGEEENQEEKPKPELEPIDDDSLPF